MRLSYKRHLPQFEATQKLYYVRRGRAKVEDRVCTLSDDRITAVHDENLTSYHWCQSHRLRLNRITAAASAQELRKTEAAVTASSVECIAMNACLVESSTKTDGDSPAALEWL